MMFQERRRDEDDVTDWLPGYKVNPLNWPRSWREARTRGPRNERNGMESCQDKQKVFVRDTPSTHQYSATPIGVSKTDLTYCVLLLEP